MSSKLTRRIAALVVAVLIPFGASASSAHAATFSPASSTYVVTAGDNDGGIGFTPYAPYRSSWS
jgi:hypothetical protein